MKFWLNLINIIFLQRINKYLMISNINKMKSCLNLIYFNEALINIQNG